MEAMSEQERFAHGNIPRDFRPLIELTEIALTGAILFEETNNDEE